MNWDIHNILMPSFHTSGDQCLGHVWQLYGKASFPLVEEFPLSKGEGWMRESIVQGKKRQNLYANWADDAAFPWGYG